MWNIDEKNYQKIADAVPGPSRTTGKHGDYSSQSPNGTFKIIIRSQPYGCSQYKYEIYRLSFDLLVLWLL
jgi:5-methylcytosine-specific restriction endonuclease McrBC regulatory subunit McrC